MSLSHTGGKTALLTKTITYIDPEDRVVEGLRIPANLNTVSSINFVLTQEPGKLKPKDLKMAIERNRAEREHRAEEQRKLREEGGGAGMLDLRGILNEEKLNAKEGDPFQRQLREMAFLADVEEVEKLENEKAFRISEDYLGSNLMSPEDINFVYRQRETTRIIQMKGRWRNRQGRQQNHCITPIHPTIKAGVLKDTAHHLMTSLFPQYDPNKNDIWQKRLNTLRRFVYLVSTWLVRERLNRRMKKVLQYFHEHGAFTRPEVRAFIEQENADHRTSTTSVSSAEKEEKERKAAELAALNKASSLSGGGSGNGGGQADAHHKPPLSATEVIFSKPNTTLLSILRNHQVIQEEAIRVKEGHAEITPAMASRLLYPTFDRNVLTDDRSPAQRGLLSVAECLARPFAFDDRSFFHQKIEPDYQYRQYTEHNVTSLLPLHFPAWRDKETRTGGPEEYNLRMAADLNVITVEHRQGFYVKHEKEPTDVVDKLLVEVNGLTHEGLPLPPPAAAPSSSTIAGSTTTAAASSPLVNDHHLLPAWITHSSSGGSGSGHAATAATVAWTASALDFITPRPEFRVFAPPLARTELDTDAIFHHPAHPPNHPPMVTTPSGGSAAAFDTLIRERMQRDTSLRNQWQDHGAGYLTAHYYLLGGAESRWRTLPPPPAATSSTASPRSAAVTSDASESIIPPMGPLLSDYYHADHDRHVSGLHCFSRDHTRAVTEWDADIAPLQHALDTADKLTDSESDHDDDFYYAALKPSLTRVKALLHPPKPVVEAAPVDAKGAKGGKAPAAAAAAAAAAATPAPATTTDDHDGDESFDLTGHQKNETQVELLRDRKTLDVESTIWRTRKNVLDALYRRQVRVANASTCVLQACRVQLPFHVFEDTVYQDVSQERTGSRFYIPTPSNVFVEVDPTKAVGLGGGVGGSLTGSMSVPGSLTMSSPTKI